MPVRTRSAVIAVAAAAAVWVLAVLLVLGAGAVPAGAHGDAGLVSVEAAEPDGTSVRYTVRVTYANDGDPTSGATVTATPIDAGGSALTPVALAADPAGDGRYTGTVDFPAAGAWTVRFTSTEPAGEAETRQRVTAPTTTTATTTTTTTERPTTTSEATDGADEAAAADRDGGGTGDGGLPVAVVLVAVAAAVAIAATALALVRRHAAPPPDATSQTSSH